MFDDTSITRLHGDSGMVDPNLGSDALNHLHYDVIAELLIINKLAVISRMFLILHFRAPPSQIKSRAASLHATLVPTLTKAQRPIGRASTAAVTASLAS